MVIMMVVMMVMMIFIIMKMIFVRMMMMTRMVIARDPLVLPSLNPRSEERSRRKALQ